MGFEWLHLVNKIQIAGYDDRSCLVKLYRDEI